MHNSGTSLAAALLHASGAPMGSRLLTKQRITESLRPAYDYLEDRDVVALNDEALHRLGRHWSSYRSSWSVPERDNNAVREVFEKFEGRVKRLLEERLASENRLWVFKDPRTALLLPSWLAVMRELDVQPRFVVVHRDAADNCRSFASKGQVPWLWAEALWQRTYVEVFRNAGIPRLLVSFRSMQQDPLGSCEQMAAFIGHQLHSGWQGSVGKAMNRQLQTTSSSLSGSAPQRCTPLTIAMQAQMESDKSLETILPAETNLIAATLQQWLEPHPKLQLHTAIPPRHDNQLRKRVAIVTPELQGYGASGGIGTAFLELGLALHEAGHSVEVLLLAEGEDRREGTATDLPVRQIPPGGSNLHDLSKELARELAQGNFDIVHVADWLGLSRSFLNVWPVDARPQLICGMHGCTAWVREVKPPPTDPSELDSEADVMAGEFMAMATADWLVSPSLYLAAWLKSKHPEVIRGDRPAFVQLNVPSECLPPAKEEPEQPRSLIFFGRLEKRKGIDTFLEVVGRLRNTPEFVHLVGSDVFESGGSRAEQALRELSAMGIKAEHHGNLNRNESQALVRRLGGVIVIPSWIENSPYAVQEFLGCGLRVVCTAVGGIPELVDDFHGRLAELTPGSLAECLDEALAAGTTAERFRLQPAVKPEQIRLSWQAFHEALPSARRGVAQVWPDPVLPPGQQYPDGVLIISLDSCRYDSFRSTPTPNLDQVGPLHRAQAPSYFTYGSHAAMFMGFLPGITEPVPFLNSKFSKLFRLGQAAFQAQNQRQAFLLEGNSVITGMRRLGYTTIGSGAVNWFDPCTETGHELIKDFDHFWFAGNSWSLQMQLDWIEERLRACGDSQPFVFLNVGETHVPYWHEGATWDRADNPCIPFQTHKRARDCRERQRACLAWVDQQLQPLLQWFLPGTIVICADHGDCWGEDGLWEHGMAHPKTLTVPLLMRLRGIPLTVKYGKWRWD